MYLQNKPNFFLKWWRGVDQSLLIAVLILFSFSLMLVAASSSSVANRIGLTDNYFSIRQLVYILASCLIILICSNLSKLTIKRLAIIGLFINLLSLILLKFYGYEVKGAIRWMSIYGFSYQPSEFTKPLLAIVIGWILSLKRDSDFPGFTLAFALYSIFAILLIMQPDFGMLIVITGIFIIQLFIAGLPLIWGFIAILAASLGIFCAYIFLPHVTSRINNFLDPANSENYQISKAMLAFSEGGLYGKGPGEGVVKQHLPDSHTDFIFAVSGEEFGAIISSLVIITLGYIVIKSLINIKNLSNNFAKLAAAGIIVQIALQSIINIGVNLNLLPTKGMTLPFISYGGSSSIALSIGFGMLIGLMRKEHKIMYMGVV